MGKAGKKFPACRKHLKRLIANFGDTLRNTNIVVVAEHASEGVARKIAGSGLLPGSNYPRVQPARQRHSNMLVPAEVAREIPRENLAQSLIIGFGLEFLLRFPLARMKVSSFFFQTRVAENPSGSRRQNVNAIKKRAVFESRAAGDKFSHAP